MRQQGEQRPLSLADALADALPSKAASAPVLEAGGSAADKEAAALAAAYPGSLPFTVTLRKDRVLAAGHRSRALGTFWGFWGGSRGPAAAVPQTRPRERMAGVLRTFQLGRMRSLTPWRGGMLGAVGCSGEWPPHLGYL